MGFKFVHASDLHLDSPLRGLAHGGEVPAAFAGATFRALERIVSLCLREQVQFLLLAGDLYDTRDRSVRARLFLHRQLSRLHQAGIQTFIVHGNHDPLNADPGALTLPPSVKTFGAQWEEISLTDSRGNPYCRVQGVSYPEERVTENLARRFHRRGPEFTIGLLHANLGGAEGHANYAPCSLDELSSSDLDYWALGHVHTRAEHALVNGGLAVYPGNPQGRHINESQARGCMVVEVEQRRAVTRFVPTHVLQWERLAVDIGSVEALDRLVQVVEEQVGALCDCLEGAEGLAVRLTLEGRGPLHSQLSRPGRLAEFEEGLREQMLLHRPPVLLESLRCHSQPEMDVQRLLSGGGLAGAVGEVWRERPPEVLAQELFEEEELRRLETALYRQGIDGPREEAAVLMEKAVVRALELLVEGESP